MVPCRSPDPQFLSESEIQAPSARAHCFLTSRAPRTDKSTKGLEIKSYYGTNVFMSRNFANSDSNTMQSLQLRNLAKLMGGTLQKSIRIAAVNHRTIDAVHIYRRFMTRLSPDHHTFGIYCFFILLPFLTPSPSSPVHPWRLPRKTIETGHSPWLLLTPTDACCVKPWSLTSTWTTVDCSLNKIYLTSNS